MSFSWKAIRGVVSSAIGGHHEMPSRLLPRCISGAVPVYELLMTAQLTFFVNERAAESDACSRFNVV